MANYLNVCLLIGALTYPYPSSQREEKAQTFFYLVNQTGSEIEVRASADGQELFVRRLKAVRDPSSGVSHPSDGAFPAIELKIPLDRQAKQLAIEALSFRKIRKTFDIKGFNKDGGGFQVVIGRDTIVLKQGYYPIR